MTLANTTLSHALADCLECLGEGGTVEECLNKYPQHRDSLRPLLRAARALHEQRFQAMPSPHFIVDLKTKLTKQASIHRKGGGAHKDRR